MKSDVQTIKIFRSA